MTTQHEVIACVRENPTWYSEQIGRHLGCCGGYVRAVAKRRGLKLPHKPKQPRAPRPPKPRKDSIYKLGRAARAAGLTVAMLNEIAAEAQQ